MLDVLRVAHEIQMRMTHGRFDSLPHSLTPPTCVLRAIHTVFRRLFDPIPHLKLSISCQKIRSYFRKKLTLSVQIPYGLNI